jgi:plasmid stabilization system protein ParE
VATAGRAMVEVQRRENPRAASQSVAAIHSAATLLADHPLAGQHLHRDIRELVISYGQSGYVALYHFVPARQEVRILAIGRQRELLYRP